MLLSVVARLYQAVKHFIDAAHFAKARNFSIIHKSQLSLNTNNVNPLALGPFLDDDGLIRLIRATGRLTETPLS